MTIQQLEYIVALDTWRHFVTAADKCFVTQPTLTMQVKKLEYELGIKIFNRCHKPLRPTREGQKVIKHAYSVLREVNQMKDYLKNRKERLKGEFHLGVIPSLAPYILPLFLPAFIGQNPGMLLKVYEMQTNDIIKALREDTIDLGLLVSPLEKADILEKPLFEEPFLVYLPEDHPLLLQNEISPSMIQASDMLVLSEGHCFRNQVLNICGEKQLSAGGFIYESGSIETLKRMVDRGMGYTLVPQLSVGADSPTSRIRRFSAPCPKREVSLAWGYNFTNHLLTQRLGDCILESVEGLLEISPEGKVIPVLN